MKGPGGRPQRKQKTQKKAGREAANLMGKGEVEAAAAALGVVAVVGEALVGEALLAPRAATRKTALPGVRRFTLPTFLQTSELPCSWILLARPALG